MPNGIDACGMLQTENVKSPTQWIVVDCTPDLRHRARFVGVDGIDYIPAYARDEGGGARALIDSRRPALLETVRQTVRHRAPLGYQGRQVVWFLFDPADPVSRQLAVELPLHVSQSLFWFINLAPAVIRAGATTDAAARTAFLTAVAPQYFAMPDFSEPYSARRHERGTVYGSLFDSVLMAREPGEIEAILDVLVPYHVQETAVAMASPGQRSAGGQLVIEQAMAFSASWRKIDWLAVAMYPYFLRLWDTAKDDILEVLDFSRCPERAQDPWKAAQKRRREADWTHLGIATPAPTPTTGLVDPAQPYNVTPGDHATRAELVGFLQRMNCHDEALDQCRRAIAEGGAEADPYWLKRHAIELMALGRRDEATPVLAEFRTRLMKVTDPDSAALYDIAMTSEILGHHQDACDHAVRCMRLDPRHVGAHKLVRGLAHANGLFDLHMESVELAMAAGIEVPEDETEGPPPGARPPAPAPRAPVGPRAQPATSKPVRPRDRIAPEVWEQIKLLPVALFVRVANADGKIDDKEMAKHAGQIAKAASYACPVARDAFADLAQDEGGMMIQAFAALQDPDWTRSARATIQKALSFEEYESYTAVLYHNAQEIAAASGGYFGIFGNKVSAEEKTQLDAIAKDLGISGA